MRVLFMTVRLAGVRLIAQYQCSSFFLKNVLLNHLNSPQTRRNLKFLQKQHLLILHFSPGRWRCSGTVWRAARASCGWAAAGRGRTRCRSWWWIVWACRTSTTGRRLPLGAHDAGCRRNCTGRSRSDWGWWCSRSLPHAVSASAAASCTSRALGSGARLRAAPPDSTPAPLPQRKTSLYLCPRMRMIRFVVALTRLVCFWPD